MQPFGYDSAVEERRSTETPISPYTPHSGNKVLTQGERIREEFIDVGRKHTSRKLDEGRESFGSRPRDAAGNVLPTVAQAPNLTPVHNTVALKKFQAIDTDCSGTLDRDEVKAGAAVLGLSTIQALRWFEEVDREVGGWGEIPLEVFLDRAPKVLTQGEAIGGLELGTTSLERAKKMPNNGT